MSGERHADVVRDVASTPAPQMQPGKITVRLSFGCQWEGLSAIVEVTGEHTIEEFTTVVAQASESFSAAVSSMGSAFAEVIAAAKAC